MYDKLPGAVVTPGYSREGNAVISLRDIWEGVRRGARSDISEQGEGPEEGSRLGPIIGKGESGK
jgi:hypothetical protein